MIGRTRPNIGGDASRVEQGGTVAFTSPVVRFDPPYKGGERESLASWLDFHRATLPLKLNGLDDDQLRRPMVPSGVCLLGLVKHLTAVEHYWFAAVFGQTGEPFMFEDPDDVDADFHLRDGETTESLVDGYLRICDRSRQIAAGVESLDATVGHPRRGDIDLRWVYLHMIEETARHNGHADIIRELIDGATGE
jgi:hypothetical protein